MVCISCPKCVAYVKGQSPGSIQKIAARSCLRETFEKNSDNRDHLLYQAGTFPANKSRTKPTIPRQDAIVEHGSSCWGGDRDMWRGV